MNTLKRIIRDCYEELHANNMDNLKKMDKFFKRYNLPRLKQEEIENMNRTITNTAIETTL